MAYANHDGQMMGIGPAIDRGLKLTRNIAPMDQIAVLLGVGIVVAALPFAYFPAWTPRMALLLCVLPLGLALLTVDAARGDVAARLVLAFVAAVVLSAAISDTPWPALFGSFGRDSSAVIIACGFGAWAVGRRMTAGYAIFGPALLGALAVSLAVALVQVAVRSSHPLIGLDEGRAHGLAGSHVYLGATMAGAATVSACLLTAHLKWQLLAAFLFGATANLSGSRFPVVVGLVFTVWLLVRQSNVRRAVGWAASYVAGVAAATVILAFVPGTESAVGRSSSEALAGRVDAWRYGLEAFVDRPILGWGPIGFRAAVQGRFSADFTANHAEDELTQIWFDAHNVVIGALVGYGALGFVLLAAFLVCAIRQSRGPFAAFAGVVSVTWLLEPAALSTFPLVMLCLGVAMGAAQPPHCHVGWVASASPTGTTARLLLLIGMIAGFGYVVADLSIDRAARDHDPGGVAAVATWMPWDPVAANLSAAAYSTFDGTEPALRRSVTWMQRAHDRQPDSPFYLNKIAQLRLRLEDPAGAQDAIDRAFRLQPWNVQSLVLQLQVADVRGDEALFERTRARLCTLGERFCI